MGLYTTTSYKTSLWKIDILEGIKAAVPIGIGYIPIAMTFGLLAKDVGLTIVDGTLMSSLVFAGASQFIAVNMLKLGIGWLEIVLTTFVLNFRHFLMGASLAQRITKVQFFWLWIIGFGITDETFSVASIKARQNLSPFYLLGINFTAYFSWVGGTVLGFLIASALPEVIQSSMGIALYAMFIGLLVPSIKKSVKVGLIAAAGALFNILFSFFISSGWALVFGSVLAAFIAALIFKEDE